MKRCTKCKEWKDETDYFKDRRKKSGLKSRCKVCEGEYSKTYQQRPEVKAKYKERWQSPKVKAQKKVYNKTYVHLLEVKARKKEYEKEYRQRPEVKAKAKKYRQRADVKTRLQKYYQRPAVIVRKRELSQRPEVKARRKEYEKEYRQRPEVKAKVKEYRQRADVKERRKTYQRKYNKRYRTDPDFRARELSKSLKAGKKATKNLEVSYLKKKLKRLGFTDDIITEEILDMKINQLSLFREIITAKRRVRDGVN